MLDPVVLPSPSVALKLDASSHRQPFQPDLRRGKVVVVGGAGYVGSVLSAQLLEAGYELTVVDSLLYGGDSLGAVRNKHGFGLHVADTRDSDSLRSIFSEATAVIHLAEIVGDPACNLDREMTLAVNYEATRRIAALAKESGVERFIYPSSCSVYGATEQIVGETDTLNPVSLYAEAKIASEQAILRLRSDTFHPTIFRLATVYGISPRPRFDLVVNTLAARAAIDGRIVVHGGGQWRPFVHVADVAGAFLDALHLPVQSISGQIFNLGSNNQNHTIRGIADLVRKQMPATILEIAPVVDHRNYRVSFDKAADVLGFNPRRTVIDGIRELAHALQTGVIADSQDPRHSNVRALIETDARRVLWRTGHGVGDLIAPFRPRDLDAARPARPVLPSPLMVESAAG